MEKQQKILQMAKDICRYQPCCNDVCKPISACDALRYAERAVEAGYSKQIEGTNLSDYPSLFECSVCHWCDGDTYTGDSSEYNYCPNCGAKMKGGDKGNE
jgi:hypothetical protein